MRSRCNLFFLCAITALGATLALYLALAENDLDKKNAENLFAVAESFFKSRDYLMARREYQRLVDLYPQSDRVPEALLRIGEASLRLYDYGHAVDAFRSLANNFADSELAPTARLKLGDYYRENRNYEQAKREYKQIVDNYTDSKEAILAQTYLKILGEEVAIAERGVEVGIPKAEEAEIAKIEERIPGVEEAVKPEAGPTPEQFTRQKCSRCHTYSWVEEAPYKGEDWAEVVDRMQSRDRAWITDKDKEIILEYLQGKGK
ncbi:MAG: tetratricopeptide repeat protein [bacterium]